MHNRCQTENNRILKTRKRPSKEQASSSSSGPGPGPGPSGGGAANPNPLGGTAALYVQHEHLAASAQHMSAGLINLRKQSVKHSLKKIKQTICQQDKPFMKLHV